MADAPDLITTVEELAQLYGEPVPTAIAKELPALTEDYRAWIDASPFMLLASVGPEGLDCSPRGDPPGFVRVVDERTLQIPDRRGNNRTDSLRNIVGDPRVALLFLVPGVGEALRVNGRAVLRRDPELCASFAMGDKVPRCVVEVTVDAVYTQCQKALVRSKLWDPSQHVDRLTLPTMGQIMERITDGALDGAAYDAAYDAAYPERLRQTIY
ncbi:MAG: pyridoxamine 5'-phosphate oxidase family protein [Acidimicrobiales bacterium]